MNYAQVLEDIRDADEDERADEARAVAGVLTDLVGSADFDVEAFAREICSGHRTHQQDVARAFQACFKLWAKSESDMRNRATVALAQSMADIHLPRI